MSEVKVNKVSPRTGTDVTVGGKLITESNGDLNLYPNGTGAVEIGGNTNPGTIILNCESNTHGVKLQSPAHSASQSYTMKLPATNILAGKFLKVASITGSGATAVGQLSFADAGGGGKINQVITAVDTSARVTTSTSFVTASSSATINITPSASNSKILIMCSGQFTCNDGNDGWATTIYRGSTNLGNGTSGLATGNSVPGIAADYGVTTMTILDSPSTTNQVTYQLYGKVIDMDSDGGNFLIGDTIQGASNPVPTHITALEVLA